MKTKKVLITGTSSGIGKATVKYFSSKGWRVAATMRKPEKEQELGLLPGVSLYALDVTDEVSVQNTIQSVIEDFDGIDVIVNNAGYGAIGIFEKASTQQIQQQFETNVFGAMNVIRAVLPHFRAKRNGCIINVTSMGGLITFPIYSVYHGTKWALEGFSESLLFELRPLNIRIKCVEPGAIKTDFYSRSQQLFSKAGMEEYERYEQVTFKNTQDAERTAPGPEVVAKAIFKAATDENFRLRYPVGGQGPALLLLRRFVPLNWFMGIVRGVVEKGFRG